jgi:autotransporter translocation and assembly factor TamB
VGYWFANRYYNDRALGQRLAEGFNQTHRGRLHLGSVSWSSTAIWRLLRNGYDDVEIEDLRIYDSRGQLAVDVPRARGRIKLWDIILHGDFRLRSVQTQQARVHLERYVRPDGPAEDGSVEEIGLLGAFEKKPEPRQQPKAPEKPSTRQSFFVVDSFALSGVALTVRAADVDLALRDVRLTGGLHYASAAAGKPRAFHFDLHPSAAGGTLVAAGQTLPLGPLELRPLRVAPTRQDEIHVAASAVVDRTTVDLTGALAGLTGESPFRAALRTQVRTVGPLISRLTGLPVVDQGSQITLELAGRLSDPVVKVRASGLGYDPGVPGMKVRSLQLAADYEGGQVTLREAAVAVLGGEVSARATYSLGSGRWQAAVAVKDVDPGPVVPPDRQAELAGALTGWLDASGVITEPSAGWTRFDLTFARRSGEGPLPTTLRAHGTLYPSPDRVDVRLLEVDGPGLHLETSGRVNPARREVDLALKAHADRLRELLAKLGQPPLLAAIRLAGRVRGSVYDPDFEGNAEVAGVQAGGVSVSQTGATLRLAHGTLAATTIRGRIYGGSLYGQARLDLYRGDVRRMLPVPRLWALGGVRDVDLAPPTRGAVEALVQGRFDLQGPVNALQGRVRADSRLLWAAGQWYRDAALDVRLALPRVRVDRAALLREAGGAVRARGELALGGKLQLELDVEELPLAVVPALAGEKPLAGGRLNARGLRIGGTLAAPVLEGLVSLAAAEVRGIPAGAGRLELRPEGSPGATLISGAVLSWLRLVSGRLDLGAGKRVALTLRFTDVPLERYVPELAAVGEVEGVASGTLQVTLSATRGVEQAALTVDHLALRLGKTRSDVDEPRETVELSNDGPIALRFDGERLHVDRLRLRDAPDVHRILVRGVLGPQDSNVTVRGRVDLLPVEILLGQRFERLRGTVGLDLAIRGPMAAPRIGGTIYPAGVVVQPASLSGPIVIRAGRVDVAEHALTLKGLRVALADDEAEVSGTVGLDRLRPTRLGLRITGRLSPRALEVYLGDQISRASGESQELDLTVTGTVDAPEINGRVSLRPLQVGLKTAGYEVTLRSGQIVLRGGKVTLAAIRGTLDEGSFTLSGDATLDGFVVAGLNLRFQGENIPYRSSGTYEVEISPDVTITGWRDPAVGFELAGKVDIVEGRYFEKFAINPVQKILSPAPRVYESSAPFYAGKPLLENLRLNLTVTSTGAFWVKNNVAEVGIEGDLSVTGTLASPLIGGTVDFKEGNFRIPFMRGRYTVTAGVVDFDRGRGPQRGEPWIRLEGVTQFQDRSETEHEITLTIQGFLSHLVPTWSSNTGLTSSQVLTLLVTSRTPDELRKGRSGSIPNLAPLIEEYLPIDLQLDLSSDSVQVFVEKKLGRYFTLKGEVAMGYVGQQRQEGQVVFQITDQASLVVRARRQIQGEDVTEESNTLSGRLEAKYRIQLRGGLSRAFGF